MAEGRPALPPIPTFSAEAPPPRPALAMAANGGGSRPALASPAPTPAPQPEGPRLARFTDVVALADAKRDIGLKMALEREVHLVRFEEGRIEFRLAEGGRQSIANDLARALDAWTGRRWIVALSKEAGEPTLDATARAATETRHQNAAAHPLVREVLARFPGAQIIDVRDKAPETSPAIEAPPTGEAETDEPEDEA
jgi:DNA polymerase-3 subunit gamma/tau